MTSEDLMQPVDSVGGRSRRSRSKWPSALLLLLGLAAAHGCQARALGSVEGSQTHFLRSCSESCGEGLECVCGVCTRGCEQDLECSELAPEATCLSAQASCAEAAAPGCGVECAADADCRELASDMTCLAGRCRGPARPGTLRQGVAGPPVIGQPCVTEDEVFPEFSGFSLNEVNIESAGTSCGPRLVCLVNRFQGRVSCPDGQTEAGECLTSEGQPVTAAVPPQLESRPAQRHVICSCRCAGPESDADYCSCPSGMICEDLIVDQGVPEASQYAGAYCTYPTQPESEVEPAPRL